jgi:hypothetical protein
MSGSTHHDDFHRREPRYKLISGAEARVLVQPQGSPEPLDAQLIDMSNSGLQLRVQTCLKFDESMAVHILAGELQFDLAASVKWIRQGDGQNWFVGCHIKPELSEDALIQLATIGLLDRRVSSRREVKLTGSICGELEGSKATAMVRNLSEDGFGLATPVARVVGQRVRVAVHRPYGEAIDVTARVIWQIKTQDGYFCGCAFLNRQHQSELSALADSKDKGLFERGGGPGRSKRRTSMWVALAALVVFVFPSVIVLLMEGHSTPLVETASKEGPSSSTPATARDAAADAPALDAKQPERPAEKSSERPEIVVWDGPSTVKNVPDAPASSDRTAVDTEEGTLVPDAELVVIEGNPDEATTDAVFKATEPDIAATTDIAATPVEVTVQAAPVQQAETVAPLQYTVSGENWITRFFGNEHVLNRAVELAQLSSGNVDEESPTVSVNPPEPTTVGSVSQAEPDVNAETSDPPTTGYRVWSDSTRSYRVVAKLVSVQNGVAKLLKENGRYTSVPIERLSSEDAEFARRWVSSSQ